VSFIKRAIDWIKGLFGPKREPRHLSYDTTTDEQGNLSDKAQADRKRIKETKLEAGDSYRLGPEATVHVGPSGKAGKAWITARIKANEAAREKKFEKWWAEKRARCVAIMMMSEEELKSSGIYDEVQLFIKENEEFIQRAEASGLLKKIEQKAQGEAKPPSGKVSERFRDILVTNKDGLMKEIAESKGLLDEDKETVG
jgi:hypothetical protein